MNANVSLEQAITEYFRHKIWATPKELVNQLYPTFQKLYPDDDTLRRLIHRILDKNDEIVPHPIRPFYVYKPELDWFNYNLSIDTRENNLDWLYAEGVKVLYKGEIRIALEDIKSKNIVEMVIDGEIAMTPNPGKNVNTYLVMVKGRRLENHDYGDGIILDQISFPVRKIRCRVDDEIVWRT